MTATAINNPYSVKNVKSFMGREGYGFECSLYKDGKRIGTVTDVCDGGGMLQMFLNKGEEEALEAFCKSLPKEPWGFEEIENVEKDGMEIDPCIMVGRLVDKFEQMKEYKKMCKGRTVFRIDGDKENEWRTIDHVYGAKVIVHLQNKYPDCGLVVMNQLIA